MERIRVEQQSDQRRCPLCLGEIGDAETDKVQCDGCQTLYHESCTEELGGCSTLGCSRAGRRSRVPAPRRQPLEVVWGRGETAGETWRTGLREEAHSRCIAWTTAFAVSVASIGGSLWEIADLDEGTIAAAIGVCAVSFFTSIVTGIQASESADAGTRLGRFWQGLTLGLRVLGVMSIFGFFTVGPLAVLVFAPPRRGAGAAVTLLIAAFGLVMTVVTALKVRR